MKRRLVWGLPPRGLYNLCIFLGQAKNIFSLHGIELSIVENLTGADYTQELIKGTFDIGTCGTPPLMAALEKTTEYGVIGTGICNYPPFYLMAADSVQNVRELKSKIIAINQFRTCPDSVIRQLLAGEDISLAEVTVIPLVTPSRFIDAIANREIQAAMLWEPWVSYVERVFPWHIVVDCPRVIKPSNYAYMIYARRSLLDTESDPVRNAVDAYQKSIEYAKAHTDELLTLDYPMNYIEPKDVENALKREVPLWNTNVRLDHLIAATAENDLKKLNVISPSFSLGPFVLQAV